MALTINIHVDTGLFAGLIDQPHPDVFRSLAKYTDQIEAKLQERFPRATISTSFSTRTSGGDSIEVLDAEGNAADQRSIDRVAGICGDVFEAFDWFVPAAE